MISNLVYHVPVKGGEVGVQGLSVDCSNILLGTNLGQAQCVTSKDMGIMFHEQKFVCFFRQLSLKSVVLFCPLGVSSPLGNSPFKGGLTRYFGRPNISW